MKEVRGYHCITLQYQTLKISNKQISQISLSKNIKGEKVYIGPGLIDLQINGINGVDFNDRGLSMDAVVEATLYLLSKGVTTYFPTIITNSDKNVFAILKCITEACQANKLVDSCIGGIHLEGPFISKVDGARGAHALEYIKAPDWQWVEKCQSVAKGRVKMITLSPEWANTTEFIQNCVANNIRVAIGHTYANAEQLNSAVSAGASLSTHLGNAVPLMLPRHPNLLWEQLANDNLYASIIADGFHLPDSVLKVIMKVKGGKCLLVSDATYFSGKAPGVYKTHIGDEVLLEEGGRLAINKTPELLAGATKNIFENIQYLISAKLTSLSQAWSMASIYPATFLGLPNRPMAQGSEADLLTFTMDKQGRIHIQEVIKQGTTVYKNTTAPTYE
ncbi:amidohydrolase family protein [Porifericola rhodea]|uniref:N-acetylglucosamine-6-phosphate deacetylase n=1 Tax=Porifericola rhodea TaxID=930972 RepID=UPI002664E958|nr:amidohydrolase family protein [Porifericola rhodea]WKN30854.1 amidohydrolase family protein [Porifericola rhodea]